MSKEAIFTMKLEQELRDKFLAAAEASHRPASQVVRELMREYVQRQIPSKAYDEFIKLKVERARNSIEAGRGEDNDSVETRFAALRRKAGN